MKHLIPYILFLIFLCAISLFAGQQVKETFDTVLIRAPRQMTDPGFGTGEVSVTTELTDGDPCTNNLRNVMAAVKKARSQWTAILASTNASVLAQYSQKSRVVMVNTTHNEGTRILLELQAIQKKYPLTDACLKQHPQEAVQIKSASRDITESMTLFKGVLK